MIDRFSCSKFRLFSSLRLVRSAVFPSLSILFLLAFVLAGAAVHAAPEDYIDSEVFGTMTWLSNYSALYQEIVYSVGKPSKHTHGSFGIGNGEVFALTGIENPQNTLTNLTGPDYEKDETEAFFPVWTHVESGDENPETVSRADITRSFLYRVKGTPIVINIEKSGLFSVTSITCAPPSKKYIMRIVTVRNTGTGPLKNLKLVVEARDKQGAAQVLGTDRLEQSNTKTRMVVGLVGSGTEVKNGRLSSPIGALGPGQLATFVLYIHFFNKDDEITAPDINPDNPWPLVEASKDSMTGWLESALSVSSYTDSKTAGLFENTLVLIKNQQDANSWGISQMARYSGIWCRDTFGPVRLLLAAGKFEEVRRMLAYYDYATRIKGFSNRYPLDLDISKAPETFDWDSKRPQQGDDPNLLILQFYWYYKATGDAEFVREHYGFLRRNLTGQDHTDYRLPFHGDETYQVWVMMAERKPMKAFYSADTSFEHVAAARAMSEMAAVIGERQDAADFAARAQQFLDKTEEYYWDEQAGYYIPYADKETLAPADSPFANINLRPLWIGYAAAGDPKQRENVVAAAKKLMNRRGTMKTSNRCGLYTGMTPGLLLYNFKVLGFMKQADLVFSGLMERVFSPTGDVAEAYDADDKWIDYGPAPTVYRSWETAIDVEAVLYYITGLAYNHVEDRVIVQPYLPPWVDDMRFDNLYAGRRRVSLLISRRDGPSGSALDIDIANTGDSPAEIELITEPVAGIEPSEATEVFESAEYGRTLWRQTRMLEPGERLRAPAGLPQ